MFQTRTTASDCSSGVAQDDASSVSVVHAPPRSPTESAGVCLWGKSLMRSDGRHDRSRTPTNETRREPACGNLGDNVIVAAVELAEFMTTKSLSGPMARKLPEHGGVKRDAVGAAVGLDRREH